MARLATVIMLSLLLIGLGAGLAASAGAIPIIKNVEPTTMALWTDIGLGKATGVAAAPNGVAYVSHFGFRFGHSTDAIVSRVGPGAWTASWDDPAHAEDWAWDVAYTRSGVYVAGGYTTNSGRLGALLLKYSTQGRRLWVRRWTGPSTLTEPVARKVMVDATGRVVVVGKASTDAGMHLYAAKYTAAGKLLWARVYTKGRTAQFRDACTDAAGNVYVAGESTATLSSSQDGLVVKYTAGGRIAWRRTYDAVGAYDAFAAVVARPAGGVYVAGTSATAGNDSDGVIYRYSASGDARLVERVGASDNEYQEFYALVLATDGRLVAAGYHSVGSGPAAFLVGKYTQSGAEVWVRDEWSSPTGSSAVRLLAARPDGAVAASGHWARQTATGPQDVMTYFISSAGTRTARNVYHGPADGEPEPLDIAARAGSVWVAGYCFGPGIDDEEDAYAMRLVP